MARCRSSRFPPDFRALALQAPHIALLLPPLVCAIFIVASRPASAGADMPVWKDVSAIFTLRCVMCHSDKGAGKGLRLDSYAAAITGSERGPVLIGGNVDGSEIIRRLRGISPPRMPFLGPPLPEEEIALIIRWIEAGLPETASH